LKSDNITQEVVDNVQEEDEPIPEAGDPSPDTWWEYALLLGFAAVALVIVWFVGSWIWGLGETIFLSFNKNNKTGEAEAYRLVVYVTVVAAVILPLYFIPSLIARRRDHRNVVPICILNLLLGCTFIGWVGALVWSLTDNTNQEEGD